MRILIIAVLCVGLGAIGLALTAGSGVIGLVMGGYPPAVWPASGPYELVEGKSPSIPTDRVATRLNRRGQEIFESSESKALLFDRGGAPILETYADGYGPDTRFNSYSLVKSLIGALVLAAVTDGKIETLDDPVGRYLPDLGSEDFQKVSLRDFLEMRSGLDFEEDGVDKSDRLSTFNPFGNLARLHSGGLDAVEVELTISSEKRGHFAYQNVNTAVLGRLLSTVYGKPLHKLLSEKIWLPAGAGEAYWLRYSEGSEVTAYCCLFATPRDWLKVGKFLMRNGSSHTPLLRRELWEAFFGYGIDQSDLADGEYGFHIRHDILDRMGEMLNGPFTYMMGQGGQTVYMMPAKDLVAVRFGDKHALLHSTLYSLWNSSSVED